MHALPAAVFLSGAAFAVATAAPAQEPPVAPRVRLVRTPQDGLQPRAAVDGKGVLHVVCYTGDPKSGDLRYVRSADGGATFDSPLAVNHERGSAIAVGNVRGAQVALGRDNRLHVLWNGATGKPEQSPLLYTRLDDAGKGFEQERDVAGKHHGLDGGGAVAADGAGNVFVVWHAPGKNRGEAGRQVWVARSRDDGKTFAPETAVSKPGTGVCPCCGLGAMAREDGDLLILYRTAKDGDDRGTALLTAKAAGGEFTAHALDPWQVPT